MPPQSNRYSMSFCFGIESMTTPITIGHPSFSAFKPYLRPANHTFMSTDNPASATTERFVLPVERAPTNVNTASRRRQRTTFTPAQADTLEKEYLTDQYMPRTRRILIAESLGLNEGQVKTWFQNRRAKEKRNDKNSVATNIQRHSLPSTSPGSSSDDNENHALVFQQLSAKNFPHVQLAI
ncbi:putative homeobox protein R06F6.6 [Toxocara canis]|uniref:Putative homeobox protein R06F6.6 n=1 Tax=Toxocara canis TaxID=6265 RepID=A0A0B2V158_TOXCA|nr:putative homeobox protein R06F6.6 [Toxocara canis]